MKYFSMFSGIGGFELGIFNAFKKREDNKIQQKGCMQYNKATIGKHTATCIGFSEIDKYAIQTYKKHFPTHKNYGDARNINPKELTDFDLLCGGFPCQSFSIAGKRKGFQDTRGTLFHEICRIVAVKRPRLLFLENVKGLLSADNGRCFATILTSLDELGYSCEWQVLNSKYFGVPQNRERVFIIGHLRGKSFRQVFPLGEVNKESNERKQGGMEIQTAQCLNSRMHKMGRDDNYIAMAWSKSIGMDSGKERNEQRIKTNGEFNTLSTGEGCGNYSSKNFVAKTNKIRRLTPIECERLQGFPDNWTIGSDTQRYKQLGNAVTVNVIEAIVSSLIHKTENK